MSVIFYLLHLIISYDYFFYVTDALLIAKIY